MKTIPLVLGNVVLSCYEADANGNAGRAIFMGARTERVRLTGRIEEFEFTGSGDQNREYGQAGEEHELAFDQIWVLEGETWEDFDLRRGRYVLAVYGQDPRSRVYYRRTYYGVQTKERSESGDQGQQYFIQGKTFRAQKMVRDNGRLAEGESSRAGTPAFGVVVGIEEGYLFFHTGGTPAGDYLTGAFRFNEDKRLTYAKVIGQAGQGADTVLQLEGNGIALATLTLPAGSPGQELSAESNFAIDIPANTLLRWRVLSAPAEAENLAQMVSVTMNLASISGAATPNPGTPPVYPAGSSGSGAGCTCHPGAITDRKDFTVPSATWVWVHNLGYRPVVEVYDSNNNRMAAAVDQSDPNKIVVTHLSNMTGYVLLVR